jgi:hypothetical protein
MPSFDLVTQFDAVPASVEASATTVDIASPSRQSEHSDYRGRLAESLHQQNSQVPAANDDRSNSARSENAEARPQTSSISLSNEGASSASPQAVRLAIQPATGQEDPAVQQPPGEPSESESSFTPQELFAAFQDTPADGGESPAIGVGTLFQFLPEAPRGDEIKPIPNEADLPSPPANLTLFLHEASVGTSIETDESSTQLSVDEALVPPAGFFQTLAAQEALETELAPEQFEEIDPAVNAAGDPIDLGIAIKPVETNSVAMNGFALLAQQTLGDPPRGDATPGEAARGEAADREAVRVVEARGEVAHRDATRVEATGGEAAQGETATVEPTRGEATHREVPHNTLNHPAEIPPPVPATHVIQSAATAPAETNVGPSAGNERDEGVTPLVIYNPVEGDERNHQPALLSASAGDPSPTVHSESQPSKPYNTQVVVAPPDSKNGTATPLPAVSTSRSADPNEQPSGKLGKSDAAPGEPYRSEQPIASGKYLTTAVASSGAAEQEAPPTRSHQLSLSGSNGGTIESAGAVDGAGLASDSSGVVAGVGGQATLRHEASSVRGPTDSAVPQSQLDQADFIDRVSSALRLSSGTSRHLQVGLRPPELGPMRVEVALHDGVLTARLEVQSAAAQKAVLESMPLLREALAQNGTVIDHIDVQLADYSNEEEDAGFTEPHDQQSDGQEAPGENQRDPDRQSENRETETPPTQDDSHLDQLDIQV